MRLKYYLRGVGIGIIVTTIIFMISISLHRNETSPQKTAEDDKKSTTISEAEKDTQKEDIEGTETEERDKGKTDQSGADKSDSDKTAPSDADKTDSKENEEDKTASGQQNPSDQETKSNSDQEKKVRFEIKGGEFSDTVCKKLKEAGLIDDAGAFNSYLIQKDYDNSILPGIYDIPKDSTYEEIAALLTTKVE